VIIWYIEKWSYYSRKPSKVTRLRSKFCSNLGWIELGQTKLALAGLVYFQPVNSKSSLVGSLLLVSSFLLGLAKFIKLSQIWYFCLCLFFYVCTVRTQTPLTFFFSVNSLVVREREKKKRWTFCKKKNRMILQSRENTDNLFYIVHIWLYWSLDPRQDHKSMSAC